MKRFLAVLVAFAVSVMPVAASALDIIHDNGSFELPSFALNSTTAPAVQFVFDDPPSSDVYSVDSLSFYLQEPSTVDTASSRTYPVTVQIWDANFVPAPPLLLNIVYAAGPAGDGWYVVDLTAQNLKFSGSVFVGIFHDGAASGLSLGIDNDSVTFGSSFDYTYPTLTQNMSANYGIRASVTYVMPATTCQGFLPPLNRTIRMKWGGRTIPLKALLSDAAGLPLTDELLATPPVVEMYLVDASGFVLEDKTSEVAPPGRSNVGQSLHNTLGGKWRYNLKTKKSFEAGTYAVRVVSGDPGEYVIDPTTCTGTFVITKGPKTKKAPKGKP